MQPPKKEYKSAMARVTKANSVKRKGLLLSAALSRKMAILQMPSRFTSYFDIDPLMWRHCLSLGC